LITSEREVRGFGRWSVPSQVLVPCTAAQIARRLKPKEDVMYLRVGIVFAIILVMASPFIWIAWWLLAKLRERANGAYTPAHPVTFPESRRRTA
jgi:hypothetical protein